MARILSHVWANILGSVGGITYFNNQYHQIVARQRTVPTNPQTVAQQLIRGCFDDAVELWDSLTPSIRTGWEEYAAGCVFPGPLGDYSITGRLMFIRNYTVAHYLDRRGKLNGNVLTNFPRWPGFNTLGPIECGPLVAVGTGFSINGLNNNPDQNTLYAFRSRAFQPSRNRFKGPWLTASLDSSTALPAGAWDIQFPNLVEDDVYFVILRVISEDLEGVFGHRLSFDHVMRCVAQVTGI